MIKLTERSTQVLRAVALAGGLAVGGAEMQDKIRQVQPDDQAGTEGLHQSASSLARKGLLQKRRVERGRVVYDITPEGFRHLRGADSVGHPDEVQRHQLRTTRVVTVSSHRAARRLTVALGNFAGPSYYNAEDPEGDRNRYYLVPGELAGAVHQIAGVKFRHKIPTVLRQRKLRAGHSGVRG